MRPRLLLPTRSLLPNSTRLQRPRAPIWPHQQPRSCPCHCPCLCFLFPAAFAAEEIGGCVPLPLPLGTYLPPPLLVQAAASVALASAVAAHRARTGLSSSLGRRAQELRVAFSKAVVALEGCSWSTFAITIQAKPELEITDLGCDSYMDYVCLLCLLC